MRKAALAIVLLALFAGSALTASDFAARLRDLGEYERAAVEYLRFNHDNPEHPDARLAKYRAALMLQKSDNTYGAMKLYDELAAGESDSLRYGSLYRIGLLGFQSGRLGGVLRHADTLKSESAVKPLGYLGGWSYFLARRYSAAESTFSICDWGEVNQSCQFMAARCREGRNLPTRSPALAAGMSAVIPGAGRAYCGRWGDGLVNLLVVGASAAGAALLWDDDRDFAVGLALTSAFFYGGGVYGSFAGARWFNEEKHRELYRYARENVPRRPEELFEY